MKPIAILVVLISLALGGCATVPRPITGIEPGKKLENLQSEVKVSVKTASRNISARGYLLFKQPDRFHLVILSPFGNPLVDIYASDDRVSCLLPSRGVAYKGSVAELPDKEGLRNLALVKWVVEQHPPERAAGSIRQVRQDGRTESIFFQEDGLVSRKLLDDGDEVLYHDYQGIDGIPFPMEAEIRNNRNESLKITFSEPELNRTFDDALLTPAFDGLEVFPFSSFTGF